MIRTSILPARNPAGRNQGIKNNAHNRDRASLDTSPAPNAITLLRRATINHDRRRTTERGRRGIIRPRRGGIIKRRRAIRLNHSNHVMKCRDPISRQPKDIIPDSG